MSECKLGRFEHALSMSKQPAGLEYAGNLINYLWNLPNPFPWGICIDLEASSTFLPLMLSMHINRLGFSSHLYRTLFICITIYPGNCIDTTALWMEVVWRYTAAVSAWCSAHQLPGCECTVKRSRAPLRCQNSAYISIYYHMQIYLQIFLCISKL